MFTITYLTLNTALHTVCTPSEEQAHALVWVLTHSPQATNVRVWRGGRLAPFAFMGR